MDKHQAWIRNLFEIVEDLGESRSGKSYHLVIKSKYGEPVTKYLSKRWVEYRPGSGFILIPEWLCIRAGIIKENGHDDVPF